LVNVRKIVGLKKKKDKYMVLVFIHKSLVFVELP